jgi:hypothetical protein
MNLKHRLESAIEILIYQQKNNRKHQQHFYFYFQKINM